MNRKIGMFRMTEEAVHQYAFMREIMSCCVVLRCEMLATSGGNEFQYTALSQQFYEIPHGAQIPEYSISARRALSDTIEVDFTLIKTPKRDPIIAKVIAEIEQGLSRALAKFPDWPTDPLHALAILGEEFGELTKDMLQQTYEPHKTSAAKIRTEALQTAAMAIRLLLSLDKYEYRRSEQHTMNSITLGGDAI